ncbi:MAG: hypothetical protein ACD_8C00067G0008 [uncultured bacterium]|nr:MAG: hypothetical protein ACD_8C00067G0008 [uncultured bacterium]
MTKFSEEIIGKIKCEHIAPVPRWCFLARGYALWVLFAISVILGSLSFAVIVHIANSGDWDVFNHLGGNWITSTVMLLPYFWLVFLGIFALVAYLNWKHTKYGYRFRRRWIVLGSVGMSVFLGNVFYAFGMAQEIDKLMTKSLPFYDESKHKARRELWLKPENGFLGGKIISVDEITEELIVEDENGDRWNVDDNNVIWENEKLEQKGKIIKVIGEKDGERKFVAKEIRRCGDCQADEDEDEDRKEHEDGRDEDSKDEQEERDND